MFWQVSVKKKKNVLQHWLPVFKWYFVVSQAKAEENYWWQQLKFVLRPLSGGASKPVDAYMCKKNDSCH